MRGPLRSAKLAQPQGQTAIPMTDPTPPAPAAPLPPGFDGIETVVADPLRFKLKLAIGEDAYAALKTGKQLGLMWEVSGAAATGGGLAASSIVAATFFAPTGWLAAIGLGGAAATPVGWIVAAAMATGGAYWGVARLLKSYHGARVDVIPRFINTPMDLLGANLLDMLAALGLRLAAVDGAIAPEERAEIKRYFVKEWGFAPDYTEAALTVIEANLGRARLTTLTATLARFAQENPDCNFAEMGAEITSFLAAVASADGPLNPRETRALDLVARDFRAEGPWRRRLARLARLSRLARPARGLARRLTRSRR